MRSLRVRLVVGAGLIILVALGTVALLSRQVARTEFRSYMIHDRAEQVRALARALGDRCAVRAAVGTVAETALGGIMMWRNSISLRGQFSSANGLS